MQCFDMEWVVFNSTFKSAHKGPCTLFGKADSVTSVRSKEPLSQLRLDGWKAIARHFGRSCRTVQRWHAEFGLPIRRLGGDKGPIYAYDDELDAWMRDRGHEAA